MDVRHRGKSGLAAAAGTDDGDDFNANAAAAELGSLLSYPILLIHSINVLVSGGGDSFCPRAEMMKASISHAPESKLAKSGWKFQLLSILQGDSSACRDCRPGLG